MTGRELLCSLRPVARASNSLIAETLSFQFVFFPLFTLYLHSVSIISHLDLHPYPLRITEGVTFLPLDFTPVKALVWNLATEILNTSYDP